MNAEQEDRFKNRWWTDFKVWVVLVETLSRMALTLTVSYDQITEIPMRVRAGFIACVCIVGYQYPRKYPDLLNNRKLSKGDSQL
jgi:hypothetical protein